VLSIFCGAGGLDLGFESVGFSPQMAIDVNPAAIATYSHNRSKATALKLDLAKASPRDLVELWKKNVGASGPVGLVGGPPCQAYSVSNVYQKKNDPRYGLLQRYVKILEAFNAAFGLSFFVFENVPGLLRKRHRRRYALFKTACAKAGFIIQEKIIDAGNFGIPQRRRRLLVVGLSKAKVLADTFSIPEGNTIPSPIDVALRDLPEPAFFSRHLLKKDIPFHPNHLTMVPKSTKFGDGKLRAGTKTGRSFRVLKWGEPSWTVAYGHREIHIHPGCHRRLSVFEAMLIQGFPKTYELCGTLSQQISLISDTVPPPVGAAIAGALCEALKLKARRRRTST
jgi:DNA (cytosine-5)-methyltransferase 1